METSPPPIEFEDRKAGLVVFGILTMLIGGVCALFVPLVIFGQTMAAKSGTPQSNQTLLPAMVMYGGLAVALVWLGIGSMKAERWARALLLIFSWSSLIIGVLSICMMAFMLPRMTETMNSARPPGQPEIPAEATAGIMVFVMIIMGLIFMIIPIVWVLFYRSRHVKATCEAYHPTPGWTDRCPLPVLAISLWLAFGVPMMLMMAVTYHSVVPAFGTFVAGPLGSAIYLILASIWGYCAWALYKLDARGLWITGVCLILFSVSAFITYSRHDIFELYALMGYPEQQIEQVRKFSFFTGSNMAWASVIGTVPMLGYLIYLRKFFPARQ